jgi:hypothetical protein
MWDEWEKPMQRKQTEKRGIFCPSKTRSTVVGDEAFNEDVLSVMPVVRRVDEERR